MDGKLRGLWSPHTGYVMWFALAAEVQKERTCISIGIYHLVLQTVF